MTSGLAMAAGLVPAGIKSRVSSGGLLAGNGDRGNGTTVVVAAARIVIGNSRHHLIMALPLASHSP